MHQKLKPRVIFFGVSNRTEYLIDLTVPRGEVALFSNCKFRSHHHAYFCHVNKRHFVPFTELVLGHVVAVDGQLALIRAMNSVHFSRELRKAVNGETNQ